MPFKDINFKISVINALHELDYYRRQAEALWEEHGDEDDFTFKPIKEVYEYYRDLELDPEKLAKIEGLYPDGGDECYMFAMNNWDGESETFDISSLEGIETLVNLKEFNPISMIAYSGVDYAPLLQCKKLERVNLEFMKHDEGSQRVIDELKARGVELLNLPE